jgi:hypothetical protein
VLRANERYALRALWASLLFTAPTYGVDLSRRSLDEDGSPKGEAPSLPKRRRMSFRLRSPELRRDKPTQQVVLGAASAIRKYKNATNQPLPFISVPLYKKWGCGGIGC